MLRPCPCRAGKASLRTKGLDERSSYASLATIQCENCGLQISKIDTIPNRGYAIKDSGKNAAIEAWNRRA